MKKWWGRCWYLIMLSFTPIFDRYSPDNALIILRKFSCSSFKNYC
jgi:hypothetical protein